MTIRICFIVVSMLFAAGLVAEERIKIVGSSTVYPFSSVVAENFGRSDGNKTPVVESTGSGGGLKLFCAGVGAKHPDITNASRAIKGKERKTCAANGVDFVEVEVGFDGIAIAHSKKAKKISLTLEQLFRALAKEVPVNGNLVANPYTYWNDIDKRLPKVKIEVLGPPPTSGTRDAFVEIAMEGGAKQIPFLKSLHKKDKKAFKRIAHTLRTDGAYIEAGENDNLIVQKLRGNPNAFGIFGFSFLEENTDVVQGVPIDGVAPTFENIASKQYPISRALFFYVKMDHIAFKPSIKGYVSEFVSEESWGDDGYLTDKGLIPLDKSARTKVVNHLKKAGVL